MATAKIWVLIVPSITSDGEDAKPLLTKAMVAKIEKELVERTMAALPSDKYSDKDADQPKGKREDSSARAIKIVEKLEVKVETNGARLRVGAKLEMNVELIRSATAKGELAATGSKGREIENRGTVDSKFEKFLNDVLDAIVGPLAQKLIVNSQFESFAKARGLPLA